MTPAPQLQCVQERAGFVMAVRGECSTGNPPRGIWELQFLRTCLKEQERGGDAGAGTRQCKVQQQQRAVVHLAWDGTAGLSSSRGDSAQPAAAQLSHKEK